MKIVIDPGHGGHDSGAGGPTGLEEATTALEISFLIADGLTNAGHVVKMTRQSDIFIELYEPLRDLQQLGGRLFYQCPPQ